MAISENTVKVVNYLKANAGKKLTSADVADAIGIEKRAVDGVFTNLQKKNLGVRVPGEVDGAAEISLLNITDTGLAADKSTLSENAVKMLDYLASVKGTKVTIDDAVEAIGVEKRPLIGTFNALVKKGFCGRTPAKVAVKVPVNYLELTAEGMAFDPTADAQ